jgi:hypothetical protein
MRALAIPLLCFPVSGVGCPLDASALLAQIIEQGPDAAYSELWPKKWDQLERGIETGATEWLQVSVAIHPATDAGSSEMLILSGGVALANSPKAVLDIMVPAHPIEGICGYPDMADERTDSRDEVLAYLHTRIEAVSRISGADMVPKRDKCLATLRATMEEVSGPNSPFGR